MNDNAIKKYPELLWLTGDVNATPEGINIQDEKNKEYNRTMLSIELLQWVISKNYENFTKCQKPKRLSKKNFEEICEYTNGIIKSENDLEAIRTYLIINDLGKIKSVVDTIENTTSIHTINHDEILSKGLETMPEISPSFNKLDDKDKKLILNGLRTNFNMGQFIQSENLPQNLETLVGIDEKSFDYYMLHSLYDIGGATGHINRNGSIIIDDDFWNKYKTAVKYLKGMKSKKDILPAYQGYLKERGNVLQLQGDSSDVISTIKLCNMLRTSDPKKAQIVLQIIKNQETNVRTVLEKELTATGIDDDKAILLYYAPATMMNAISYFKSKGSNNPIADGLNVVLPTFARIYSQAREKIDNKTDTPNVTTVMISEIAKQVGKNPINLNETNIKLHEVGDDFETNISPVIQNKETDGKNVSNDDSSR